MARASSGISEGLIVTNDHVVRGDRAVVELGDGRRLEARVTARDRENDLALLRVSARDLPAAPVGDFAGSAGRRTDPRRRPSLGRPGNGDTGDRQRDRAGNLAGPDAARHAASGCRAGAGQFRRAAGRLRGAGRRHRQHGDESGHRPGRSQPCRPAIRPVGPGAGLPAGG